MPQRKLPLGWMAKLRSPIRERSASRICAIVSALMSEPVTTTRYEMICEATVSPHDDALAQMATLQGYSLSVSLKLRRRLVLALDIVGG